MIVVFSGRIPNEVFQVNSCLLKPQFGINCGICRNDRQKEGKTEAAG